MLTCPRCTKRLSSARAGAGIWWSCGCCGGLAATLPVLRRKLEVATLSRMWLQAGQNAATSVLGCPSCGRPMKCVRDGGARPSLDVCRTCQLLRFDRGEIGALPVPSPAADALTPEGQEAHARLLLQTIGTSREPEQPDRSWKLLAGTAGLPIEFDARTLARRPWVTWSLAIAVAALGAWMRWNPWLLVVDVYFLAIFGDDVEDHLGSARFAILLLLGAAVGIGIHSLSEPAMQEVWRGWNAAVACMLVYYALQFPRLRIGILLLPRFPDVFAKPYWIRTSAGVALVLWVLLHVIGWIALDHAVTHLAQLGGATFGLAWWLVGNHKRLE